MADEIPRAQKHEKPSLRELKKSHGLFLWVQTPLNHTSSSQTRSMYEFFPQYEFDFNSPSLNHVDNTDSRWTERGASAQFSSLCYQQGAPPWAIYPLIRIGKQEPKNTQRKEDCPLPHRVGTWDFWKTRFLPYRLSTARYWVRTCSLPSLSFFSDMRPARDGGKLFLLEAYLYCPLPHMNFTSRFLVVAVIEKDISRL